MYVTESIHVQVEPTQIS